MCRIIIALLFVFAIVGQSALLGDHQEGIRPPAGATEPSGLPEYADSNDSDLNLLLLSAIIVLAKPPLMRLVPQVFAQNPRQTEYPVRDGVPLYEMHAVWRI